MQTSCAQRHESRQNVLVFTGLKDCGLRTKNTVEVESEVIAEKFHICCFAESWDVNRMLNSATLLQWKINEVETYNINSDINCSINFYISLSTFTHFFAHPAKLTYENQLVSATSFSQISSSRASL